MPLSGLASFDGRVRGAWQAPALDGTLTATRGALRGIEFDQLSARLRAAGDAVVIHDLALRRAEQSLTLAGTTEVRRGRPLLLDARLHAEGVNLAETLPALGLTTPLGGLAMADLQVTGVSEPDRLRR